MDTVDARARLERPFVPVRAYRDAARHLVPLVTPTLVVFPATVVIAAALKAGRPPVPAGQALTAALVVLAGLALFTMPALLAVPAIVLEGRSAPAAIGRGYVLVSGHMPSSTFTLALGVYVIPGAVSQARR
ncbi:hypothetical protein ACQEVF_50805 [Nonomuraea polychroma]|uniref:hypothetical protein n=1 Tax=Nonomuraea polychroma TaxID=46176 RepID=UPI003D8E3398